MYLIRKNINIRVIVTTTKLSMNVLTLNSILPMDPFIENNGGTILKGNPTLGY